MDAHDPQGRPAGGQSPNPWWLRSVIGLIFLTALASIWTTNTWLTERFSENTRVRSELRLALYTGNLLSELQRTAVVPLLLARDPALIGALQSNDFSTTSARLMAAQKEIGAASIRLLDASGRTVGATDRYQLGTNNVQAPYYVEALRSRDTVFSVSNQGSGAYEFTYSRAIVADGKTLGVIVVGADLTRLERSWAGISDAVAVTDSAGDIILATEPRWRGLTMPEALAVRSAPSAIQRAFQVTADWTSMPADAYLQGRAVMRSESRIPFRGWRMISFTTYASIRERVNAVLALEIMGFAILLAGTFYVMSRRARRQSAAYMRESADLRALNARLTREIAERERVQKELRVAEQTVQQSSKLAALGEMSAGVSHELNQPLAAMKTYLAGARLLLQRGRSEEALSSFQRIDDLIERMGAITRQLKSYARKGGEAVEPVDLRAAVSSALTMMEPQLRSRTIRVNRNLPRGRNSAAGTGASGARRRRHRCTRRSLPSLPRPPTSVAWNTCARPSSWRSSPPHRRSLPISRTGSTRCPVPILTTAACATCCCGMATRGGRCCTTEYPPRLAPMPLKTCGPSAMWRSRHASATPGMSNWRA